MHTFTDLENRTWNIRLTCLDARKIADEGGIDIVQFDVDKFCTLWQNPLTCLRIASIAVADQREKKSVSVEEFESAFDGDNVEQLCEAVRGAIVDFFPKSRRPALVAMKKQIDAEVSKALNKMKEELEDGQPSFDSAE